MKALSVLWLLCAAAVAQKTNFPTVSPLEADYKSNVRVATTGDVSIGALVAGYTVDGVPLTAGDRVLVKSQSTPAQNGIYVAGASPARATDADTWTELPGCLVLVTSGTANAGTLWRNSSAVAGSLGTNAVTWAQVGAGKFIDEYELTSPHQVDGTGAVVDAVSTSPTYGHAVFSATSDKAVNYVLYRFRVPFDLDPNTDLQVAFTFRLNAADTGKHSYEISMADVTASASGDLPAFSNAVMLNFDGDASGAAGDLETIGYTTLTGWKSSLTAGHILVIKLARDGDETLTTDTSAQASSDVSLTIKYGRSQ